MREWRNADRVALQLDKQNSFCVSALFEGRVVHTADEQKETFEKFHDCWSEYMSLGEAAIFEYAFKLGARIALAMMYESNENRI